jgi:hypothetical protein
VDGLRDVLLTLSPTARDKLRRVLILDQPDRDAIAQKHYDETLDAIIGRTSVRRINDALNEWGVG